MILDAITKKIQIVLSGAVTTSQLQVTAAWGDTQSGDTFVPGATTAVTNGATPIDIVAAPAAATQRTVREITVYNADTVAQTVFVQLVDGANTRIVVATTIQPGETLFFANGEWYVIATNGSRKTSGGVTSVGFTAPAIFSVAGQPVTTAGTIAVSLASQAANLIWAGPATGAAAAPTFRTLAAADIPTLSYVTSVAQTVPAEFSIAGSPITASGTLAITKATQAANLVWAGPTTGAAAQPAFRSLVAADIPSLSSVYLPLAGGTLTGALGLIAGTAAAPAIFISDPDTGFFYSAAGSPPTSGAFPVIASTIDGVGISYLLKNGANTTYQIVGDGGAASNQVYRYQSASVAPNYTMAHARNTAAAPAVLATNDLIGQILWNGFGATVFVTGARMESSCIDTTPSDTAMGTRMRGLLCAIGSAALTETWRFEVGTGFSMFGANPVIDQNRIFHDRVFATLAALTAAVTAPVGGMRAFIQDNAALTFGLAAVGGGTNNVPVYYNAATAAWMVG